MKEITLLSVIIFIFLTDAFAGYYNDNSNGTVSDRRTGLIWQQEDDNVERQWESAISYCEDLELGSNDSWRLPNRIELESISEDSTFNPAINTTFFPNANSSSSDYWWSSTTFVNTSTSAWIVGFYKGMISYLSKTTFLYVRCVWG